MKITLYIIIITILFGGCNQTSTDDHQTTIRNDFQKYFEDYNLNGSFILYDLNEEIYTYVNPGQKDLEFPPASTFKICNSLIGLETGVIEDENYVIPWDSVERNYQIWNQDFDLAQAIKYSVVWYYQELARRVGEKRMQEWINKADYGNKQIGGGIDQFWLRGDLRITPSQQIEFLKQLYNNDLPFSNRNMAIVRKIIIVEQTENYTLHAKTGFALVNNTGWYVGFVKKDKNVFFFTTCVQGNDFNMKDFGKARIEITRNILKDLEII